MKKPNVPMNHAITTCRHKVDRDKWSKGYDLAFGKKKVEVKLSDPLASKRNEPIKTGVHAHEIAITSDSILESIKEENDKALKRLNNEGNTVMDFCEGKKTEKRR